MRLFFLLFFSFLAGCMISPSSQNMNDSDLEALRAILPPRVFDRAPERFETLSQDPLLRTATFAGGCFWCLEAPFESQDGVLEVFTGFSGGDQPSPSYQSVAQGLTNHREAVQIFYNPEIISYDTLLRIFWKQIDPTDEGGQFSDSGFHYTTAIFWHDESQKIQAESSKKALVDSGEFSDPIATKIIPFTGFYLAEEDHQNYYLKQSVHYKRYKKASGRADFIEENNTTYDSIFETSSYQLSPEEIAQRMENLDPESYHVIAENGTEKPFDNKYWNNTQPGLYVDKVTREPLFSSTHKYDSGTGWPSFYRSIQENNLIQTQDDSFGMNRVAVEAKNSKAHLGHVFNDGPQDKGGQRFCINSASLDFVPLEEVTTQYPEYLFLFEETP